MLKIWGRADGSNVIKAMWCIGELGLEYERIDWGGKFGGNDDPEYRRKNPNGRLPTLEEEDGWTLWESGAVVRYLCEVYSKGKMCPETPRARADADKWMDWSSLNLAKFNSVFLDNYFRLPEAKRSMDAIAAAVKATAPYYDILDAAARRPEISVRRRADDGGHSRRLADLSLDQLGAQGHSPVASERRGVVRAHGGPSGLSGARHRQEPEAALRRIGLGSAAGPRG